MLCSKPDTRTQQTCRLSRKLPDPFTVHHHSWRVAQDLFPTRSLSLPQFQGGRKVDASIWNELCSPKRRVRVSPPGPQNVTLVEHRVFTEVSVKMRSLGWALIQYAWCPYKKGKFDTDRYTQGKTMGRHREKVRCPERRSYKSGNAKDCWKTPE